MNNVAHLNTYRSLLTLEQSHSTVKTSKSTSSKVVSFHKIKNAKQMHIDGIRHNYGMDSCQFTIPCLQADRAVPKCDKYSQCQKLQRTLKDFI